MNPELKEYLDAMRKDAAELKASLTSMAQRIEAQTAQLSDLCGWKPDLAGGVTGPVTASSGTTGFVLASAGLAEPLAPAPTIATSLVVAPAVPTDTIVVALETCSTECPSYDDTEPAHASTRVAAPTSATVTVDVIPLLAATAASDGAGEAIKGAASTAERSLAVTRAVPRDTTVVVHAFCSAECVTQVVTAASTTPATTPPTLLRASGSSSSQASSKPRPIPWPSFVVLPGGVHLTEPRPTLQESKEAMLSGLISRGATVFKLWHIPWISFLFLDLTGTEGYGLILFHWSTGWQLGEECSDYYQWHVALALSVSSTSKDNECVLAGVSSLECSLGVQYCHGNIFERCPSAYMAMVMLLYRNYSPLNSWSGYTALQCTTASVVQICKLMYGNKRLAWEIISDVFLKCNQYVCCVDALKPWSLLVRMVHICWLLLQEQVSKGVAVLDTQQLRWFSISVFSVYNTLVPELVITEFQQPNLLCHHQSLVQLNYQVQDVGLESICKLSGKNTQAGLRLPDEDYLCYFLCWDSGGYTLFSLLALDRQMTMEKGRCSLISVSHLLNRYRSLSFIDYLLFNGLKVLYTPWEPDVHNAAHHAPAFVVLRRERGELIQWLANDFLGAYRIWLVAWTVGGQGTFKGGRHMPALGRHKELRSPWDPGGAAATCTQAAFDVIAATAWDQQLIGILYRNSGHNNEHRLLWDPGRFLVASAWGQAAFQGGRDVRSLSLHGLFPGATTWAWPVCQSPRAAGYINTWRRQRRGYPEGSRRNGRRPPLSHLGS